MRLSKAPVAAIVAFTFIAASASPTLAQRAHRHVYRDYDRSYEWVVVGERVCTKICPQDNSPCDPIYFKTADGRCNSIYTK
jgi:hypothetical protein